jgi:pimeloyl-ACP methyl ester carboxylesterase
MAESAEHQRRVVLLHGLGRSPRSMRPLQRALEARDYVVLNCGYRSRSADIATLAADVADRISRWEPGARLDFVTHSLGGILLRAAVAYGSLPRERIRRVVMLGPPNAGSEVVDAFRAVPLVASIYAVVTGPAGVQLGTTASGLPRQLPPVDFEIGVIAGNRSFNPIFSAILGADNDGKVRVERTRVEGMREHLVVPVWHPLLVSSPTVIHQVAHFLETGGFR